LDHEKYNAVEPMRNAARLVISAAEEKARNISICDMTKWT